jgi:hypothetical protein
VALRTLVVLSMQLLQVSKLFKEKKTYKNFDDAKWMLTVTRVAPECQGTSGAAHLCHGTLADEHTYRVDKRAHEKRVLGIEVP